MTNKVENLEAPAYFPVVGQPCQVFQPNQWTGPRAGIITGINTTVRDDEDGGGRTLDSVNVQVFLDTVQDRDMILKSIPQYGVDGWGTPQARVYAGVTVTERLEPTDRPNNAMWCEVACLNDSWPIASAGMGVPAQHIERMSAEAEAMGSTGIEGMVKAGVQRAAERAKSAGEQAAPPATSSIPAEISIGEVMEASDGIDFTGARLAMIELRPWEKKGLSQHSRLVARVIRHEGLPDETTHDIHRGVPAIYDSEHGNREDAEAELKIIRSQNALDDLIRKLNKAGVVDRDGHPIPTSLITVTDLPYACPAPGDG